MTWRRELWPAEMARVAIVAPVSRMREVLVEVAGAAVFEPDAPSGDELVGDASFDAVLAMAHRSDRTAVVPGWVRADDLDGLRDALDPLGGAVADLPGRRGLVPPTAHVESRPAAALRPLVTTYGTVPARDVDPTWFAAVVYVLMFGMMFGDVGHGLGVVLLGVLALRSHDGLLAPARRLAPFLIGAGAAATGFGLLLAIVNRWREGGPRLALYDSSGIAGAVLLLAVGAIAGALVTGAAGWWWLATALGVVGTALVFAGLLARTGGSGAGLAEAIVELFDTLLRLGSNIVSFTRLAAFGLTHAVITEVVWDGSVSLWGRSAVGMSAAVVLFVAGNAGAFALGALVAAIQALRLEYYELFSRLFAGTGRPFTPWYVPLDRSETS
jgi:V/A-type H+-transporting ATPase subunit I